MWYQIEPAFMFFARKHNFYVQFLLLLIWYVFFYFIDAIIKYEFFFMKGGKALQEKSYGVGAISKGRIQNKCF